MSELRDTQWAFGHILFPNAFDSEKQQDSNEFMLF